MKSMFYQTLLAFIVLIASFPADAAPLLTEFVVFGDRNTSPSDAVRLGGANILSGLVGSNSSSAGKQIHIQGSSSVLGVYGAGAYQGGSNVTNVGNMILTGDVSVGGGSNYTGNLNTSGTVNFGNNVVFTGDVAALGDLALGGAGGSNYTGNFASGGDITSGSNITVNGNLSATGTITLGGGSIVTGTQTTGAPSPVPQIFVPVVVPSANLFSAGGVSVTKGANQTTTLSPGVHGAVSLGSSNELFLSSGAYYLDSLTMGASAELYLDLTLGGIELFVVDEVSFGSLSVWVSTNNGTTYLDPFLPANVALQSLASGVYLETSHTSTATSSHSFHLSGNGDWFGTVFAPNGRINTGNGISLIGQFVALGNGVDIGGSSILTLVPSNQFVVISEPSTAYLLMGALALLMFSRWRLHALHAMRN